MAASNNVAPSSCHRVDETRKLKFFRLISAVNNRIFLFRINDYNSYVRRSSRSFLLLRICPTNNRGMDTSFNRYDSNCTNNKLLKNGQSVRIERVRENRLGLFEKAKRKKSVFWKLRKVLEENSPSRRSRLACHSNSNIYTVFYPGPFSRKIK